METLKKKLIELGFTEREAFIYLLLLTRKHFTATEVANEAGVSRPIAYETLNKLIEKEFCIKVHGNVSKFTATDPKIVMEKINSNLHKKQALTEDLGSELTDLFSNIDDNTSPYDFITVLHSRNQIVHQAERMENAAEYEVLSFSKPPYAAYSNNLEKVQTINKAQFNAMNRGVKYRTIYEAPADNIEDFLRVVTIFTKNGEEVRISEHVPMKMLVFDYKNVIYMVENKPSTQAVITAVVVKHSDLNETLRLSFESSWEKSLTIKEFAHQQNAHI